MSASYRDIQQVATLLQRCRELRRNAMDAEALLWRLLRGRQLAGAKFRRQHRFGPYILDFYCTAYKLAIEVDGGQHFDEDHARNDAVRTDWLEKRDVRVLRFTNLEVLKETEAVANAIWQALGGPSP